MIKRMLTSAPVVISLSFIVLGCGNSQQKGSYTPGAEPQAPQASDEAARIPSEVNWLMMKDYWQISDSLGSNVSLVAAKFDDFKQPEIKTNLEKELAKLVTPAKQVFVSSITLDKQTSTDSIVLSLEGVDSSTATVTQEGALRLFPKAGSLAARVERVTGSVDLSKPDYWFSQRGVEAVSLPQYFSSLSERAQAAQSSTVFKETLTAVVNQKNSGRTDNLFFSELSAAAPKDACIAPDAACVDTFLKIVSLEPGQVTDTSGAKGFAVLKIRMFGGPDDGRNTAEILQ
jgi:hypothetical protein